MPSESRQTGVCAAVATLLFYLAVTVGLQWWAKAFEAPFGSFGDDSSHFLSSLLVHDYIRAGLPGSPLEYATEYYLHLPLIAIGYWPPLFYVIAALWMFVAGVSRAAVLCLVAVFSSLVCLLIQREVARRAGFLMSLPAGLLFAVLPAVAWSNSMVMLDITVGLFAFLALLSWASYLETGGWARSVWFGIWASAAVLAKTSGAWVFLLFPLGLLLARKDELWRRGATWLPVAVAMCCCLPWFLTVRQVLVVGLPREGEMGSGFFERLVLLPWPFLQASFWPWLTLAAWLRGLLQWRKLSLGLRLIVLQPLAFVFAYAFTPVGPEARYAASILPVLLILLADFLGDLSTMLGHRLAWWRPQAFAAAVLLVLAALSLMPAHRNSIRRTDPSLRPIVSRLMQERELKRHVVLVSSKGPSGDILVEAALQERHRPGAYLARANKLLARSSWMGENYRLAYDSPAAALQALDENCVGSVLVAAGLPNPEPHHSLLLQTIAAYPERFRLIDAVPQSVPYYELYSVQNACPNGMTKFRKSASEGLDQKLKLAAVTRD